MKKGLLLVILSAVLFGAMPPMAKFIYSCGATPMALAFFRFAIASPALFLLSKQQGEKAVQLNKSQKCALVGGALAFGGTPALLYASYQFVSSGMATTIHFVYPIIVVLLCAMFFKERLGKKQLLCCVLCTGGLLCFYTPGGDIGVGGILLAFASGLTYAAYIVIIAKSGLKEVPPYRMAFLLSLIASVAMFPILLATGGLQLDIAPVGWVAIILFALLISGVAVVCFQTGARICGAQRASFLSSLEPVTSIALGVLLYREAITVPIFIGIVAILASVILLCVEPGEATH